MEYQIQETVKSIQEQKQIIKDLRIKHQSLNTEITMGLKKTLESKISGYRIHEDSGLSTYIKITDNNTTNPFGFTRPIITVQISENGQYSYSYEGSSFSDETVSMTVLQTLMGYQIEFRKLRQVSEQKIHEYKKLDDFNGTFNLLTQDEFIKLVSQDSGYVPSTQVSISTSPNVSWVKFTPSKTGKSGIVEWINKYDDTNFINHKRINTSKLTDYLYTEMVQLRKNYMDETK